MNLGGIGGRVAKWKLALPLTALTVVNILSV